MQEGEIDVNPYIHITNDGQRPPLVHVDSDVPLYSEDGRLVWDQPWGIYFKRDKHGGAGRRRAQGCGRRLPCRSLRHAQPLLLRGDDFYDLWVASLAHCMKRFEGKRKFASHQPSGGVGAFSADNFPIFDFMRPNVYVIADSNHGFKMIGVGEQVARLLTGQRAELLEPFAFQRFAEAKSLPKSKAPFPWM